LRSGKGLRDMLWGGDGEAVQPEKCSGVENCLKIERNPANPLHALSGAQGIPRLLDDYWQENWAVEVALLFVCAHVHDATDRSGVAIVVIGNGPIIVPCIDRR